MKKRFTLAEVLVTLGIIGVVAALVMPAAQKLIPDKTKTQYLILLVLWLMLWQFTTQNGMRWRIVPAAATSVSDNNAIFQTDIYVDIDPSNNNVNGEDRSCIYNVDSSSTLMNNEVYNRLKNKISTTSPPTIKYNGQTYKIPQASNNTITSKDYSSHSIITVPNNN